MSWINEELKDSKFSDKRLKSRFLKIMNQLFDKMGSSIPMACQDWANTKAAYRFFSNPNLSEEEILEGHFHSTKSRFDATEGSVLVLHDTTEMTYTREKPTAIGYTRKCGNRKGLFDQDVKRAMCGVLMHSSLVLTLEGVPLGFAAKKFWNREKFKDAKSLSRKQNATRIPIEEKESYRWLESIRNSNKVLGDPERLIHVGDREADVFELFHTTESDSSNYLVRIKVNRRTDTENDSKTIHDVLRNAKTRGNVEISYRDEDGEQVTAILEMKFERIKVRPPFGPKSNKYPNIEATIIWAKEISKSGGNREPIDWKLITNLPVEDLEDSKEKLRWYALRWKIEVFFKVLKSGCKVEESKLRTADALCKLIAIYSIVAWRIFWMTMLSRDSKDLPANLILSDVEIKILDNLQPERKKSEIKTLSHYLIKIAKLGGYLARASDSPPGNTIIWRGMQRLIEIRLGVEIGLRLVGN